MEKQNQRNRIAIIRIRGKVKIKKKIEYTMKILRLYNKHTCIIIPNTEIYIGMLKKIKDYVTWGEIDPKTFKNLLEKRGRLAGKKHLDEKYLNEKLKMNFDQFVKEFFDFKKNLKDIPGLKPFFRLKPPTKGFDRKGIKRPFSLGGALGYRKDKINELIMRMI